MADFYGCLMSTSFHVKDMDAWKNDEVVKAVGDAHEDDGFFDEENGLVAFGWHDQYPSPVTTLLKELSEEEIENGESDEQEYNILDAIQAHIVDGEVCQVSVSGNEKLRYIGGPVWFITSKGVVYFDAETSWDQVVSADGLKRTAERFLAEINAILT